MTQPDPFSDIHADLVHAQAVDSAGLTARKIMLVPGGDVALMSLELPKGLRGQNREHVARRQLRDRLGMDADTVEMRPFQMQAAGDGWTQVLVADKALIDTWRDLAGHACQAVLPDYLALPTAPDLWTMAATPDGAAVRLGPQDGFAAPIGSAVAALDLALRTAKTPPKAILRLGTGLHDLETVARTYDVPLITETAQAKALDIATPQTLAMGETAMDLRKNPQMARALLAKRVLPWRWPLLLGLIAAGLWVTSQVVVMDRIKEETRLITASTTTMVREHFVPNGPILDARIQVSQALAQRRAEAAGPETAADPLALFNQAAVVLAAQRAALKSATYGGDGALSLILTVADFAAADEVAEALAQSGLGVTVIDTRVDDAAQGVRSELRIAPPAEEGQ